MVDEKPYAHLQQVAHDLLGRPLPPLRARWAGIDAEPATSDVLVQRAGCGSSPVR